MIHLCFVWLHRHVFSMFMFTQMCVCARVLVQVHGVFVCVRVSVRVCLCVYAYVCVCRLDGAHRVRRCCRALLTAAGNQSTLSVYSPTRRFLNDLP